MMAEIFPEMSKRGAAVQVKCGATQLRDVGMTFGLAQISARVCAVWILLVGGVIPFVSTWPRLAEAIVRVPVFGILRVYGFITFASVLPRP
jgi:hypothetical protein